MEAILFKLFERQPNWSLKQLVQETDQPEVRLPNNMFLLNIVPCFISSLRMWEKINVKVVSLLIRLQVFPLIKHI